MSDPVSPATSSPAAPAGPPPRVRPKRIRAGAPLPKNDVTAYSIANARGDMAAIQAAITASTLPAQWKAALAADVVTHGATSGTLNFHLHVSDSGRVVGHFDFTKFA